MDNFIVFRKSIMSIIEITNQQHFDEIVLKSQRPTLVDFVADWCGPCKILSGKLADFIKRSNGWNIAKVNIDDNEEIGDQYQVENLPTVLIIHKGVIKESNLIWLDNQFFRIRRSSERRET